MTGDAHVYSKRKGRVLRDVVKVFFKTIKTTDFEQIFVIFTEFVVTSEYSIIYSFEVEKLNGK